MHKTLVHVTAIGYSNDNSNATEIEMNTFKVIPSFVIVALWIGGAIGWVLNIVDIYHTCCELNGLLILRVVGIFVAPLGAVLGYF